LDDRFRRYNWFSLDAALVLAASLSLGLFVSRVLAELPRVTWPFYRWGWTIALTAAIGGGGLVLWATLGQRSATGFARGITYLPLWLLLLYVFQPAIDLLQAGVLLAGAVTLVLVLALPWLRALPDRWIAFLLFAIALAAYLSTLTPAVGTRDGYELQAVSATLGFAHPTGYPLFPIVGRLWLLIFPLGSIAWRINVLCALYAAVSAALLYGTARRVLGQRSFAALCALLYMFSHTLWTQAVRPEKYTFNAFFVSLVLYIALGTVDPEARGPHPHLRWLALAYGFSLGHHRTMLMLAPALAVYLLWRDPGLIRRPREWLPALGLALAPLLVYLYIPWRAAVQGWMMSLSEFVQYVSGAYYGPAVRLTDWLNPARVQMFWRFLVLQYGHVGVALGVLGLVGLGLRRRWRTLACTALAYLTYYVWGTVWYAYYNDVNSFIPNHMLFAVWIASGALTLYEFLRVRLSALLDDRPSPVLHPGFWPLLLLLPMWMAWTNAPQVDARDEWNLTRWGELAIAQDIAQDATILADREKHPPLDYFARVERRRPDVDVAILGDEKAYLDRLAWDLAHEKTVYLARFLPGLEGSYHLRSLGPLVEVGTAPLAMDDVPAPSVIIDFQHLQLLHYKAEEQSPLRAGEALRVTLYWHVLSRVPGNYQVNLRLVDVNEHVWWTASDHPVSGMYPTAAWKPGEVIPDWHEVPVDETILPGTYRLEVGLFPPFSSQGLEHAEGVAWLPLRAVWVVPSDTDPEIPRPLRAVQPGAWQLVGYDLPRQAPPTGRVPLALYWQPLTPLPDLEVGTCLDTFDTGSAWCWEALGRGVYPTSQWLPGTTVVTKHDIVMPPQTGEVAVQVAVRSSLGAQGGRFHPRWLGRKTTILSLPPISVEGHPPAAPGTVNYDDRILLLETDLAQQTLPPGGALEIDVRWQCLRTMEADYTLFVQLLAPDGTLKGQIDVWPRDGTHPTGAWREGETIEDSYVVPLDPDAPPGEYQVAIGWYLLETMQRLPVLDAGGNAVGDAVLLPGVAVGE
jgi:hypothetical protein